MISDVSADPATLADGLRPVLLRLSRELRRETESLGVTSRQVGRIIARKSWWYRCLLSCRVKSIATR